VSHGFTTLVQNISASQLSQVFWAQQVFFALSLEVDLLGGFAQVFSGQYSYYGGWKKSCTTFDG